MVVDQKIMWLNGRQMNQVDWLGADKLEYINKNQECFLDLCHHLAIHVIPPLHR